MDLDRRNVRTRAFGSRSGGPGAAQIGQPAIDGIERKAEGIPSSASMRMANLRSREVGRPVVRSHPDPDLTIGRLTISMAESVRDPHLNVDSAREILDEWNLGRDEALPVDGSVLAGEALTSGTALAVDRPGSPHFSWDLLNRADSGGSSGTSSGPKLPGNSVELFAGFELEESQAIWGSTQAPGRGTIGSPAADAGRDSPTAAREPGAARRAATAGFPTPGTSWRVSGSSSSWVEGLLHGSILPRKSTWAGGWSRSRSRVRRERSRRSSPGFSIRTSCRCTPSRTTPGAGCASSACRISAVPTWRRSWKQRAAWCRPTTTGEVSSQRSIRSAGTSLRCRAERWLMPRRAGFGRRAPAGRRRRHRLRWGPPAARTPWRRRDSDHCSHAGSGPADAQHWTPACLHQTSLENRMSTSRRVSFFMARPRTRRQSGSSLVWLTAWSMPIRAVSCTAT